jgi:hypothetical protein
MDWFNISSAPKDGRPVWVREDVGSDYMAQGWAYWQEDPPGGYWAWAGRKGRPAYPDSWAVFEPVRRY